MQIRESPFWLPMIRKGLRKGRTSLCVYDCKYGDRRNPFPDWFELELAGWQQAIKLMEDAVKLGKGDYVHRVSMELISSSQAMGTRGGGTSGSWFPGKPETPAEKAWERVRRHPLFHAFSALALIEYQCSPAKAALRVARFGKWVLKVHSSGLFNSLPSCSRAAFGALTGGRLRLETWQFRITEFS